MYLQVMVNYLKNLFIELFINLDKIISFDIKLFLKINGYNNPNLDIFMYLVSNPYIWIFLYLLFLVGIIMKEKKFFWLPILILIIGIGITDFTSVHLFKETIRRLRPCHNPQLIDLVHTVGKHCGGKYGFISTHAANAFMIITFLSYFFRNKIITISLIFWGLLISYSRIYLGVHYPLDVLSGAIWGIIIGALSILIYKYLYNYMQKAYYFKKKRRIQWWDKYFF